MTNYNVVMNFVVLSSSRGTRLRPASLTLRRDYAGQATPPSFL